MASEKRFLVVSKESQTKKIPMTDMSYQSIMNVLSEKFGLTEQSSTIIKYFDTDVDEWVDFDEDSEEFTKHSKVLKLNLFRKSLTPDTPTAIATPTTVPTQSPDISTTPTSQKQETPTRGPDTPTVRRETPMRQNTPIRRLDPPSQRPDSPMTPARPKTPTTPHQQSRKSWPRKYLFPNDAVPRAVQTKFELQQTLNKREMRMFMDALYLDITKFQGGLYPSSEMYEEVVDAILSTHPYLTKVDGLPMQSVRSYWKGKLIYKFGNARRRNDSAMPEVVERKRKKTEDTKAEFNGTLTWGLRNYSPPESISEDKDSINAHVEWLRREWRKTDPELSVVDLKMGLTFAERRRLVLQQGKVAEIVEKFPWLQCYRQLLKEFTRLGPDVDITDIDELFHTGLEKYMKAIIALARKRKSPQYLQEIYETIGVQRIEAQRNYTSKCCAILGLAVLFKEKSDQILVFGEEENSEGRLKILVKKNILTTENDAFELIIEDLCLFKCGSFMELLVGLEAAIYTFDLVYPKCWEKTLIFIQNVILGLKDNEKLDKRIVTTFMEIRKEME